MTRTTGARTVHRCAQCGAQATRWSGRCPACGEWNCLVEEARRPAEAADASAAPQPVSDVDLAAARPRATGVPELDRVLGGGLVAGSVTLVGGEPGIGKSTLLLQAMASLARHGSRCLLVSAEESAQQVRLRAGRLDALESRLWTVSETSLPAIRAGACCGR